MSAGLLVRLAELNLTLPKVSGPFGSYVPVKRVGSLLYVAGQLPMREGTLMCTGPVPSRASVEQAKAGARQCVLNALGAVRSIGVPLDELSGVVRVGAFVASDATFTQQPQVANGSSDLLIELFGEAGKHVRAAVGVNVLPLDASVEVEFVFEMNPSGPDGRFAQSG